MRNIELDHLEKNLKIKISAYHSKGKYKEVNKLMDRLQKVALFRVYG